MANIAGERKKGRNRNTVENCGRGDTGKGIAAIFLMGGALVAGVLWTAIIASKRKKEKTNNLGIGEKKEILDSCKGAMDKHEDDLGLRSILPLDVKGSNQPIVQERRPGSSTNREEKASLILQEKELSGQFMQGLKKGEAPILESKIEKGDLFLHHLEAFPPSDTYSLDQKNLQVKIVDNSVEKEGDAFLPHLEVFPHCNTSSLDQQNFQAEKIVNSTVSQLLHDESYSSLASILSSQNAGSGGGDGSTSFLSLKDDSNDIGSSGCSDHFVSMPSLENDGSDIGNSGGGGVGDINDYSVSLPSLENDGNDMGGGCDGVSSVSLLSLENHGDNNGGGGSRHHHHAGESFASFQSLEEDGNHSAGGDGDCGVDSSIFMQSLENDFNGIGCNSGCGSGNNVGFVSPSTLEYYGNDSGAGGGRRSGDSSVFLLSSEDDGNDSGGSDDHHNSVFLPLLQKDRKGDGGGSSPVSHLLLQDDGCAGNHSGGSGLDDCDGDSSLSLLLLQDDGGGDQISNSDDYDMDHEKENSSVAFELENSAPGAITIPIAAEVISCGSYSEGFSAGTSPITTWPQISTSGCSKQISETNRLPYGIPHDVGDNDVEDDDQSKCVHFDQKQRRGIEVRKIFEEDMRCTQELVEEASWSREALGILQSVDTNLLILSVGAVLLLFVLQFFIHVNMS